MKDKRQKINPQHPDLSIAGQCTLVDYPRSSYYYQPCGESPENLGNLKRVARLMGLLEV